MPPYQSCCLPFVNLLFIVTLSQPPQFKLDPRLARLLGLHTQSRSAIVQALWQYVKTNRLQDSHDKEYINGDKYFQQVTSLLNPEDLGRRVVPLLNKAQPTLLNAGSSLVVLQPRTQGSSPASPMD